MTRRQGLSRMRRNCVKTGLLFGCPRERGVRIGIGCQDCRPSSQSGSPHRDREQYLEWLRVPIGAGCCANPMENLFNAPARTNEFHGGLSAMRAKSPHFQDRSATIFSGNERDQGKVSTMRRSIPVGPFLGWHPRVCNLESEIRRFRGKLHWRGGLNAMRSDS